MNDDNKRYFDQFDWLIQTINDFSESENKMILLIEGDDSKCLKCLNI